MLASNARFGTAILQATRGFWQLKLVSCARMYLPKGCRVLRRVARTALRTRPRALVPAGSAPMAKRANEASDGAVKRQKDDGEDFIVYSPCVVPPEK